MTIRKVLARYWWAPLGLVLSAGCIQTGSPCCDSDSCGPGGKKCPRMPAGAIQELTGTHTRRITDTQEFLAEADDLVIYEHEWLNAGTTLGPFGMNHLGHILSKLPHLPFPVVLEFTEDALLNTARRNAVMQYLVANGVAPPEAEARVIVAYPLTEGLYGDEAAIAFERGFRNYGYGGNGNGRGISGGYGGSGSYGGGYSGVGASVGGLGVGAGRLGGGFGGFGLRR